MEDGAEAVRLAGRQGLFDRRYRRRPLREAHRRGDRAGRDEPQRNIPASRRGGLNCRRGRPLRAGEFRPLRRLPEPGLDHRRCSTFPKQAEKSYADGKILQSVSDGVGVITFNNPEKRNAMSLEMWEGLGSALIELRDDPDVRVVILVGAGDKAFVSGADISQFEKTRHNARGLGRIFEDAAPRSARCWRTTRSRRSPASAASASAAACRWRC